MKLSIQLYIIISVIALPLLAWAGRPLSTDDATLTVAHTCQIENWYQQSKTAYQTIFIPACNPTGNFEVATGLTTTHYRDGSPQQDSYVVQGKTIILPQDDIHHDGLGLVFGVDRPNRNSGDNYAYVPMTVTSANQAWTTDFDLGWRKELVHKTNTLTWGLASVYAVNEEVNLFAEVFGDNKIAPTLHSGISIDIVPEQIQLDLTYGNDLSVKTDGEFFTIGLNYYMPK